VLTDATPSAGAEVGDRRRRWTRSVAAALAVLAAGLWWTWPGLRGDGDAVDVLVLPGELLVRAERSITLRVREQGLAIEWFGSPGWCDDPDRLRSEVDDVSPDVVVVAFTDDRGCAAAAAPALAGVRRVAVVDGPDPGEIAALGYDVVDPSRLVGQPGAAATMPCEWWEAECPPAGIEVRGPDGELTDAGGERLARMLAARL
jgi:hypothetical protein